MTDEIIINNNKSPSPIVKNKNVEYKDSKNVMYELEIKPLPVKYSSSPQAQAHLIFPHMPKDTFVIGENGGTISFHPIKPLLEKFLSVTVLATIVESYCYITPLYPLNVKTHHYFRSKLFVGPRPYEDESSDYFYVNNEKPIVDEYGKATMYFRCLGPAICFNLLNLRDSKDDCDCDDDI